MNVTTYFKHSSSPPGTFSVLLANPNLLLKEKMTAMLSREAGRISASDVIVPVSENIVVDSSLINVIHQLVVSHSQSILVTNKRKPVEILRLSGVFQGSSQ